MREGRFFRVGALREWALRERLRWFYVLCLKVDSTVIDVPFDQ